jgi:GT2 family glycosyltransferase
MNNTVNIGMVTYNRLNYTKQSIESILATTTDYPYVLTVIDNNSQDGTQDYLKGLYKEGKIKNLVLLNENLGVAKASNIAWQMEDSIYYMKYDNDIIAKKNNWLSPMIAALSNVEAVGMIGYSVEPHWHNGLITINGYKLMPKISNLGGACVVIPRRTQDKLGFWCEDYGVYSEEDADYGRRIEMLGLMNVYMPDTTAFIHLSDIQSPGGEGEYFNWKHQQRLNAMSTLGRNLHDYLEKRKPMYVPTNMKISDIEQYRYRG